MILSESDLTVRAGDRRFYVGRGPVEEGQPTCLCSRCGQLIPAGTQAVRVFHERCESMGYLDYEYRYHARCLQRPAHSPEIIERSVTLDLDEEDLLA
jgi:hypothetical protein